MKLRATALGLTWAACAVTGAVLAQDPPAAGAAGKLSPLDRFREVRDLINDGAYDLAAERLKDFLAAAPADKDLLDIQARYGATAFDRLRLVPRWSDNPDAQKAAVEAVDKLIARAAAANKAVYQEPARVARYVRNLGGITEERLYAQQQLKLAGDAAVAPMVEALRTIAEPEQRAGIYTTVAALNADVLPGFLAAADGLNDELKLGLLRAVASRPDLLSLLGNAETDITPALWYYSASPADRSPALRAFALDTLPKLVGPLRNRRAEQELVALAKPFADKKARFASLDAAGTVKLWAFDPATQTVAATRVPRSTAEEYYGAKYLRWAQERGTGDPAVGELFLALLIERAVERAGFGELAAADPKVYAVAATASTPTLANVAARAAAEKKPALLLGAVQLLADRGDKAAAPALSAALDYADARVQLAAAVGLMRIPGPPTHGKTARVIEVLARAATADTADAKGKALLADPDDARGGKVAGFLGAMGYKVERVATGRDLLRRLGRSSDVDLILIDRHVVAPELTDILAAVRGGANAEHRPVAVVASTNVPKPVPFEHQLLRLAALVAATETDEITVPPPFAFDPNRPVQDVPAARQENRAVRDRRLAEMYNLRVARLTRLVESSDLQPDPAVRQRLALRVPQFTWAALVAEYPVSAESAPDTLRKFEQSTKLIDARPELATSVTALFAPVLSKLSEELEAVLDGPRKQRFAAIHRTMYTLPLSLPADTSRDEGLEDRLRKLTRPYPGVAVIREPYAVDGLAGDLAQAVGDPAEQPVAAAVKKASAVTAVTYLSKAATGEIPGYDVRPAADALRAALGDDTLAPIAVPGVARLATADAQAELVNLAVNGVKPVGLRLAAADAAVSHVQRFSNLSAASTADAVGKAAAAEADAALKGRLAVLAQLIGGKPGDLGGRILTYPVTVPKPVAVVPAPPPEKKDGM